LSYSSTGFGGGTPVAPGWLLVAFHGDAVAEYYLSANQFDCLGPNVIPMIISCRCFGGTCEASVTIQPAA
jgi:hypothetical protein